MIRVRPWAQDDAPVLLPMILDLLGTNVQYGAELLPTERNACMLCDLGMVWATRGEPTMVALDESDAIIAFTLWGDIGNPLSLDTRDRMCTGIGTYVVPGWRRQHVASKLRREALQQARRQGYDRVVGVAYYDVGVQSMLKTGAKKIATVTEWRL